MADEEQINIRIRLRDAARFAQETRRAKREIDELGDAADRANRKSRRAGGGFNILQNTIKLVRPAALIASVGLLAQVLSAASAGGVGLVVALVPLIGLLGALPALGLLAGQGLGVTALGLTGVAAAVGGLNAQLDPKKFALLSRPAQDFALLLDSLKTPIRSLQLSVQRGLFPGLSEGLKALRPGIAQLQGPLKKTGEVLGSIAARAGRLVGSRGFLADLRSQAYFNAAQIEVLGGGALHLVNVLRILMVVSRPLVAWMVRLVAGWAAGADRAAQLGQSTGNLAAFFDRTRLVMSQVIRITTALGRAFWNVAKGGQALGNDLLVSLTRSAERFAAWTGSARGQNAIADYFRQARGPIYETGKLVRDITTMFFRLGTHSSVAPLIRQVRTQLLPVLESVVTSTTAAFGPHAVAAIIALAQAFAPLAGSTGPLVLYVDILTGLAKAAFWVERNVPGATTAITALVGAIAIYKAANFAAALTGTSRALRGLVVWTNAATAAEAAQMGVIGSVKALWGLLSEGLATMRAVYIANTGVTNVSTLAVLRHAAASKLSAAATAGLTAATWLLNVALDANPVVLIALAIVALGAALVLAYTKVGFFRHGVQAAFGWIQAHWPLLLTIITGPIGLAVSTVVTHFGKIKSAASSVFGFVARLWNSTLGRIHFKVPGWVPGMGGHGFAFPKVPGYANGTLFHPGGMAIVGERGPELLSLPRGARVDPLPAPTLRAPRLTTVSRSSGGGRGDRPIVVQSHVTLKVDRRTLAKAVSDAVADETARG